MTLSATPQVTPAYRRYLLGLMMLCLVVNYIDRQLPAILLPQIKKDLDLSDTQLGFITGLAFGIFYSTVGIPLGRIMDTLNRRKMLAACIGLWSCMTALSGSATNFATMAFARFGVGIGEAGLTPAAYSMLSDLYPPKKRAGAFGIFAAGIPFGLLIAFLGGGWITEYFGWRVAFVALGLPGVILSIVVLLTVKDTPRGGIEAITDPGKPPPFWTVFKTLFAIPSFRHCCLGTTFTGLVYTCIQTWVPSFLSRSFGMSTGEIGSWLAPAVGLGGLVGTIMGGALAGKLALKDERWMGWVPAISTGTGSLLGALTFAANDWRIAVAMISFPLVLCPVHLPIYSTILQNLASVRMRASFPAISLFVAGLIGVGIGPQMVGIASDLVRPFAGEESLRYALMLVVPFFGVWGAIHFYLGGKHLPTDFANARQANAGEMAG
ncbi:MAG: MFS transporter [Rhodospirillaceae bacterium]|nr:MFS transporter [Rhodospirillaceae bacterium]